MSGWIYQNKKENWDITFLCGIYNVVINKFYFDVSCGSDRWRKLWCYSNRRTPCMPFSKHPVFHFAPVFQWPRFPLCITQNSSVVDTCMGLLPDTNNCGSGMPGTFPTQPQVRDARAVMPIGITNQRFPLKSVTGKTFPAFCMLHNPLLWLSPSILHHYMGISDVRCTKSKNLKRFSSRLAVASAQSIANKC